MSALFGLTLDVRSDHGSATLAQSVDETEGAKLAYSLNEFLAEIGDKLENKFFNKGAVHEINNVKVRGGLQQQERQRAAQVRQHRRQDSVRPRLHRLKSEFFFQNSHLQDSCRQKRSSLTICCADDTTQAISITCGCLQREPSCG
ncbi:MAG: hypothetical protein QM777_01785 [Pseudorhodoferax sp.]